MRLAVEAGDALGLLMSAGPTPPANARNCRPDINTATPAEFELVNPQKASNFILGELSGGALTFVVENLPKTTPSTGCPGWWMFGQMMDHFGDTVVAVVGSWTYGDNLAAVNRLTGGTKPVPLEDAARQTATARYAASRQYVTVTVASAAGTPGNYTRVRVLFTK